MEGYISSIDNTKAIHAVFVYIKDNWTMVFAKVVNND